ncbi:MAG: GuaB1 family IMP dehydrogenase-related protein [Microbacteriaceae bacterium]
MQFLDSGIHGDLTYSDVFLVPSLSDVTSRYEVDLGPGDGTGMTIPLIASNMNAVTGPRLAATIARRGGIGVLPQDMGPADLLGAIRWVKAQSALWDSPYRASADTTVGEALTRLPATRGFAFVVTEGDEDLGVVPAELLATVDRHSTLGQLSQSGWLALEAETITDGEKAYEALAATNHAFALVVRRGHIIGTISDKTAVRSTVYTPNVNAQGTLGLAAAVGINGDVTGRAKALVEAGVDVLVLDTAHGHQRAMVQAVEAVAALDLGVPIVAGNVVTAQATNDLVQAGANIVKVGVGPGAMCTTRMMTAVGRPQFSAVLEAAEAARAAGAHVWADGGVQFPRDVALALAAGARGVMIGSWFAGNIESPGEIQREPDGELFKTNWGMASTKAVTERFARLSAFERARKAMFSEGISESRVKLDPERPSIEDSIDAITAGVRSSMTYAGARDIEAFHERAVVGVQSAAGYEEGRARERISR